MHKAPDGTRIYYERQGERGPLVALLPGLGGDARFWAPVAADLVRDHRLVLIDHRGAGRSDRPRQTYSLQVILDDVAGILRELGEPVHFVGHSTGGAIAQMLGLQHPGLARSLTLSSTWAQSDARFRELFIARAALLHAGQPEIYQRFTNALGHGAGYLAAHAAQIEAGIASAAERLAPFEVTAQRVEMLLDHDTLAALPAITLPTLVIAAEEDALTPPSMARPIAEAIPGAEYVQIPGAHFHPQAEPAGFAALIRNFISHKGSRP